jgi:hypothetical protein
MVEDGSSAAGWCWYGVFMCMHWRNTTPRHDESQCTLFGHSDGDAKRAWFPTSKTMTQKSSITDVARKS